MERPKWEVLECEGSGNGAYGKKNEENLPFLLEESSALLG